MRNNKGIKDLPIWKTDCEVRLEDRYHPHRNLGRGSLLWGAGSPCPPQMNPEGEMTMKPDYRNWMPRGMIVGLDVGCGSGALTIACAKRNPQGRMVGIDRWGVEYASYSRKLCERNAQAEGVDNAAFQKGDARHLDFPDETFDAVTSNYVYHNVMGADKRVLLLETLRVLKKGGVFALNDDMKPRMYGDMEEFARELRDMGYEDVRLIDTAAEAFGSRRRAAMMMLGNSRMLVGRK